MKSKRVSVANAEQLAQMRHREKQIALNPSAESYLKLAHDYHSLGLGKESDRLLQLAETYENGDRSINRNAATGLLSGAANPIMVTEVIQILSRMQLSGDLAIDSAAQTFHLYFYQGQIINASSTCHSPGVPSFRMALRVSSGTYRFVEQSVDAVSRLIGEPTEILLLNAVHDEDKEAAGSMSL